MKFQLLSFFILMMAATVPAGADVQSAQDSYRNLFEKIVAAQSGRSLTTETLIYQLPESSLTEAPGATPENQMQSFNQSVLLRDQARFLKQGLFGLRPHNTASLFRREALRKKPVTLVIIPGVFGEFIDPLAFHEVTGSKDSTLGRQFQSQIQNRLKTQGPCKTGTEPHCDYHFALETMSLEKNMVSVKSLDQLLSVTSLDDSDGTPLARVILFKTPRMSLESISRIEDVAKIFNRRLQKYFALSGGADDFAFVGYSRGTMLALEMLRQTQTTHAKALFVVGGVTMGSDLADQILVPDTAVSQQLNALRKLSQNLRLTHQLGFLEAARTRFENLMHWLEFIQTMAALSGFESMSLSQKIKSAQAFLKANLEKNKNSDPKAILQLALSVAANYGLIEQVQSFPFVHINSALSHEAYSLNVARFQKFVEAASQAALQLTTPERLKWWSQAVLPKNFTLYTFAATLADPASTDPEESHFAKTQWASGPFPGADYLGLLENYRDYRGASGASLNDSQVSVNKVIGWPASLQQLNPQIQIQNKFLALFGAHHWALALPVVNVNKDQSINPFPRRAFLESMAHVFASERSTP